MKMAVFSTRAYDKASLTEASRESGHELVFFEPGLNDQTAGLARGFDAVCIFVNDKADASVVRTLAQGGTKLLALRSAGFNHVDILEAAKQGITVARVPAYSPYAVAEHAVALMLTLNRKTHRAFNRVREQNFALDGLMGFDLHGKTVGLIGTGKTGAIVGRIMTGFGCNVVAFDPVKNDECVSLGIAYKPLEEVLSTSDIVSLHCPLNPKTRHLIDARALSLCRDGFMLVNTSRGAVVDTKAVIESLKSGKIGGLAIDVYEEEGDLFFRDLSEHVIQDDVFARLLTFPNVLITAHQAFFTREAVRNIADTTIGNLIAFASGRISSMNLVTEAMIAR